MGPQLSSGDVLPEQTLMFREASEASAVVLRQRAGNVHALSEIADRFRASPPRAVVTLARGSSDHAATYARYLLETRAGLLTSSASPSVGSIYDATPDVRGTVMLAISQSGKSPDLLAAAGRARDKGAFLVAMVNDEESPLGTMADALIPLAAGPERSVAATKSFIASLAAALDLLGFLTKDPVIEAATSTLPGKLEEAWALDWTDALPLLGEGQPMYVVGRGLGLGIAQEAALKLKETCGIQAEGFSAAEVRHGPMAIVRKGFPVLLFGQPDEGLASVAGLAKDFAARGACVLSAGVPGAPGTVLPVVESDPLVAPILQIASFYRLANALALVRGRDPDRPPHLAKVTETL